MDSRVPIELLPHQEDWVVARRKMLDTYKFAIDVTRLGGGKTYTATHEAEYRQLPLYVVGPAVVGVEWDVVKDNHYEPMTFLSYNELRGHNKCKYECLLKHNLLYRHDVEEEKATHTHYRVSDDFKQLVSKGIVFVVDEMQGIKNKSITRKAVEALVSYIRSSDSPSVVILMSGLPIDKGEQIVNLMYSLGVATAPNYCWSISCQHGPYGLVQVVNWFIKLDPRGTEQVIKKYGYHHGGESKQSSIQLTSALFCAMSHLFIGGCSAPAITTKCTKLNSYYLFDKSDDMKYALAMTRLRAAIDPEGKLIFTEIPTALREIEKLSCNVVINHTKHIMETVSGSKVIIYATYMDTYEFLESQLSDYGVLVLNGDTRRESRKGVLKSFHTDPSKRVFLVGLSVGGVGLNLQDKVGDAPRYSFIFPTYHFMNVHQASGRTHRPGALSDSVIRVVYNKLLPIQPILESIKQKSVIASEVVKTAQDVVLPTKYPIEYPE